MHILHLTASPRGEQSVSTRLSRGIVERLLAEQPGNTLVVRDLAAAPFPHLEEAHLQSFFTPAEQRSPAQQAAVRHSDEAIAELQAAEVLVIGVPFYNLGIPSTLKAWIDHVARAGRTFRYSAAGPEGLLTNKKVYLALASGGVYSAGPQQGHDFAIPYLSAVLGFLGLTDVTVVRAEGLALPELQAQAWQKALDSLASLATPFSEPTSHAVLK